MAYLNCLVSPLPAPEASLLSEIALGLLPLLLIFAAVLLWILYIRSLQRALERCSPALRAISPEALWLLLVPVFSFFWHFFVVSRLAASLGSEFSGRNLPNAESRPGKRIGMAMCILPLVSLAVFAAGWFALAHDPGTGVLPLILRGTWISAALAGLICWISYWVKVTGYSKALAQPQKAGSAVSPGESIRPNHHCLLVGIAGLVVFLALSLPSALGFLIFEVSGRAAVFADAYAAIYPHWYSRFLFSGEFVSRQRVSRIARQQAQRQYPQYADSPIIQALMERQIGQHMIQQQILLAEAGRLGFHATRDDVDEYLHQGQIGAVLYPDGQYIGDEKYAQLIQEHFNIPVKEFEEELRSDIVIRRLEALITAGVTVSDAEVRGMIRRQNTRIRFDYAVISADDLRKTINPSDSDLEAFFSRNAARYASAIPEQRRLAYLAFAADQAPGGAQQPTQQEIQQYFELHKAEYSVPEQARSRHILIKVARGADAKTDAAARAKAEALLRRIQGGANFAELAKQNSDDSGSKDKGGELGFARRGMMVPEFENAIFTQKIGDTRIVKTSFGYHLVQVEERQTAHSQPLSEVEPAIREMLTRQKAAAAEESYAKALASEAGKNGLEKTAAAHHLQVVTTPLVGARGLIPGFADSSQVLAKAFQSKQGDPPQYAPTGEGYAIFQVAAIAPAHAPAFAGWKSQIAEDYRNEQLGLLLSQKTTQLAEKAKASNDLVGAAKEADAAFKSSDMVGMAGQVPDLGQIGQVAPQLLDLAVGDISGPILAQRTGVVAKILDKQEPTAEEIDRNLDPIREKILDQRRTEAFNLFLNANIIDYRKHGRIEMIAEPKKPSGLIK
jgi:peptidyl-prolyl cis-trans isomerase D